MVFVKFYLLAALVATANISLNVMAQRNAAAANSIENIFGSWTFVATFLVGSVSLAMISVFYYFSKENSASGLAEAMLIMGVCSISGGVLFGMLINSEKLSAIDWWLFAVCLTSLTIKFLASQNT